jgi:hypothetical protein
MPLDIRLPTGKKQNKTSFMCDIPLWWISNNGARRAVDNNSLHSPSHGRYKNIHRVRRPCLTLSGTYKATPPPTPHPQFQEYELSKYLVLHSDKYNIFFFLWHYSPLWALACRTISFHFFLSATNSLHLLTPSTWRSLSTPSFHLFLGLLLLLNIIYTGSITNVIQDDLTAVTTLKTTDREILTAHFLLLDSNIPASQLLTNVPKIPHHE